MSDVNIQPKELTTTLSKDKPKIPNSRWHCLTSYIPIDIIKKYLECAFWVKHWSIIEHSKDVYLDDVYNDSGQLKFSKGSPKETHTHILLYCKDAKTSSAVVKRFNNLAFQYALENNCLVQNTLGQLCTEPLIMFRYQLHLDDKDKYQYSKDNRFVDSELFWSDFEFSEECDNKALAIFDDIRAGLDTRQLISKYGCTFAHNSNKYYQLVRDAIWREKLNEVTIIEQDDLTLVSRLDFFDFLSQIISIPLLNSPFNQSQINDFWNILRFSSELLEGEKLKFDIVTKE